MPAHCGYLRDGTLVNMVLRVNAILAAGACARGAWCLVAERDCVLANTLAACWCWPLLGWSGAIAWARSEALSNFVIPLHDGSRVFSSTLALVPLPPRPYPLELHIANGVMCQSVRH